MLRKISVRSVPTAVRVGLPLAAVALLAVACGSSSNNGSGGANGGGGTVGGAGSVSASQTPGAPGGSGSGGNASSGATGGGANGNGAGGANSGGSGGSGGGAAKTGGVPVNHGKAAVGSKKGALGTFITDQNGWTLYFFSDDSASASACTGACATTWPPLTTKTHATVNGAAAGNEVGSIVRPDGTIQVTYAGHPLYYFSGDTAAGQTNGEGLMNKWFELAPSGLPILPGAKPFVTGTPGSGG